MAAILSTSFAQPATASAATWTLASITGVQKGHVCQVESELAQVLRVGPGLTLTVQRGIEGTATAAHATSTPVAVFLAGDLSTGEPPVLPAVALRQAVVTLTDAQIKALSTTNITVVSAPGPTGVLVPVRGYLVADCTAGLYTNITTYSSTFSVRLAGGAMVLTGPWVDEVLGDARLTHAFLAPYLDPDGATPTAKLVAAIDVDPDNVNKALQVRYGNAAGNLTGGHSANFLRLTVLYHVFDVTTGLFV